MPIYSVYRDDSLYFRHLTDDEPKDSSFQMHIHEQCEILYFVRGSAGSLIETSSHRLLPDTLLLMRPMESTSSAASPTNGSLSTFRRRSST